MGKKEDEAFKKLAEEKERAMRKLGPGLSDQRLDELARQLGAELEREMFEARPPVRDPTFKYSDGVAVRRYDFLEMMPMRRDGFANTMRGRPMGRDESYDRLERELAETRAALNKAKEAIKAVADGPMLLGSVLELFGEKMIVSVSGQPALVAKLAGAQVGDTVLVAGNGGPVAIERGLKVPGPIATVGAVTDGNVEVEFQGQGRVVRCKLDVEAGDRVILDPSGQAVVSKLGASATKVKVSHGVSWDDVGGQDDAKAALREAIEMPYLQKELFAAYGKKPLKGVLLWGPPGTGKTMLAKACATALAKVHGVESGEGFIYVKGPELLSQWVGQTEAAVRKLFAQSRAHSKKHGYPALLFIDEADAILRARGSDRLGNTMSSTVVPQFLSEMDGLEDNGAMVLLATNKPESLDAAVLRDGRIDRRVLVDRPTQKDATAIFALHLRGVPAKGDALELHASTALWDSPLHTVVSGALIAGLVGRATTRAMQRDMKGGACVGVTKHDLVHAVADATKEMVG